MPPPFPPQELSAGYPTGSAGDIHPRNKQGPSSPPSVRFFPRMDFPLSPRRPRIKQKPLPWQRLLLYRLEAPPRFELGNQGFADPCLTTWLWRRRTTCFSIPVFSALVKMLFRMSSFFQGVFPVPAGACRCLPGPAAACRNLPPFFIRFILVYARSGVLDQGECGKFVLPLAS